MSAQKRFSLTLMSVTLASSLFCAMLFGGSHPPTYAQQAVSSEDAVEDSNIAAINKHLEATDARADKDEEREDKLDTQLAEMQGEQRSAFAALELLVSVLGVLTAGSIVVVHYRFKQVAG